MKVYKYSTYGSPEVLKLGGTEKPIPKADEVLIKVKATTVTATDCIFRKGTPFISRLYMGLTKPKYPILGDEWAGKIEAIGKDVTLFSIGDEVFGSLSGHGAYAEYICLPEEGATLAKKPSNQTFEEAAASTDGPLTALPFLRDTGNIQEGQKVLINGASGSVGTYAVQLAKYFGAEVTGVCSTATVELVKSIGADHVIDYKKENFTRIGETWDIIFDTVGNLTFTRCKKALSPNGVLLEAAVTLSVIPRVLWTSLVGSKKVKIAATGLRSGAERTKDLIFLRELIEAGKITAIIDRTYPFEEMVEAHRYVDTGRKKGNVVISL